MSGRRPKSELIEQSLRRLADALPLHAEESLAREVIHESTLIDLVAADCVSREITAGQVAVMRRVLTSLGLLDSDELTKDRWAFVSFPAMLLAKSVLETLSTPWQQFFVQGYWTQGNHRTEEEKDAQRALLSYLEDLRVHSNPSSAVNPIRVVHVAWGFIRIDGRFALHRREDKARRGAKRYVPPGGRVIPEDLPEADRKTDTLRTFWSPDARLPDVVYEAGLKRELAEELSLKASEFRTDHIRTVDSFLQVEGSANNRAYTRYCIRIYSVKLTRPGELVVLDRIHREPTEWAWFTAEELSAGKNAAGDSAYIDALAEVESLNSPDGLSQMFPDSSAVQPRSRPSYDAIQIPADHHGLVYVGKSGKQKPHSYNLSHDEWSLLITMAWHSLGHPLAVNGDQMDLLDARWVRLKDEALLCAAKRIAAHMKPAKVPVLDLEDGGYCRLDYPPENVFLDPALFEYEWLTDDTKKRIRLELKGIGTPFAILSATSSLIPLADKFARDIARVEQGREPEGEFTRTCREHFKLPTNLGLRVFATDLKGMFEIAVPHKRTESS